MKSSLFAQKENQNSKTKPLKTGEIDNDERHETGMGIFFFIERSEM